MEPGELKCGLINEIFIAYREAGIISHKTKDEELRGQIDLIRIGLDRMLKGLLPLEERDANLWEELRATFKTA